MALAALAVMGAVLGVTAGEVQADMGLDAIDVGLGVSTRELLDDYELYKIDRLHLHMEYTGEITLTTRVCRGLDSVQAILEGRIARLAGCDMDNVRAVALVCFEGGLNVSLKFDTPGCRRSAVDAVSLGLSVMQNILADPLENQYHLTLVSATPKLADGMVFSPPPPREDPILDDDWSYYRGYYGDYYTGGDKK